MTFLPGLIHSPIFGPGVGFMAIGGLMATLRKIPDMIWSHVQRVFVSSISIDMNDPLFPALETWLAEHPYSSRAHSLKVKGDATLAGLVVQFLPSHGSAHYLRWQNVWFKIQDVKESGGPGSPTHETIVSPKRWYSIAVLGRSSAPLRALVSELVVIHARPVTDQVSVYTNSHDYWNSPRLIPPRAATTLYLPTGQWDAITADIAAFDAARLRYNDRGIPYRRGYLLEGTPGTGKSTTVLAIASTLHRPLYCLALSDPGLTDSNLVELLGAIQPGGIVLLEDIDAIFIKRDKTDDARGRLTFSGLLNALDGINAPAQGQLLFMTTNHVERLDPALIRPGRCDRRWVFGPATAAQIVAMAARFGVALPSGWIEARLAEHATVATLQEALAAMSDPLAAPPAGSVSGPPWASEAVAP